jgi:uncharacterized protein (DUF1499 family)
VKSVDTSDLKSEAFGCAGSSPAVLTKHLGLFATALLLTACTLSSNAPISSFGNFIPPTGHVHYLACPEDYCLTTPDEVTPLLSVAAERLRDIVRRVIDAQPRIELISEANEGLRLVYRQNPVFWGSADTVTIDIVDADDGVSGIVLYSESDKGSRDVGANRERVHDWLKAIDAAIAQTAKS